MVTRITRTIGPSGRDYASFTLAEADVTNIGTSADLVANDEAIVFEADAGTYNESVNFSSTLTTDATRNVTYKAAAGSEHGGDPSAGVIVQATSTAALTVQESYTVFDGLHVKGGYAFWCAQYAGGTVCRNLICTSTGNYGILCTPATYVPDGPFTIENCVVSGAAVYSLDLRPTTVAGTTVYDVRNCTLIGTKGFRVGVTGVAGSVLQIDAVNNMALLGDAWVQSGSGTVTVTGSNNFGGSSQPFPAAIQGSPYPITATTSFSTPLGSGDYAVYMGATGALADVTGNDVWQQGVGPASNSDVPTTDINGVTRSGTRCNPGAFEADGFVAPTTITKTVGSGKDYATPTLAEADVPNIGSGLDRTFYNEAVVFEIDAGTYGQLEVFNSTLTYDQTRNTTYRAAAGSEHQGQQATGVVIDGPGTAACYLRDPFAILEGVNINNPSGVYVLWMQAEGVIARSCVLTGTQRGALIYQSGTSNYPCTIENCVAYAGTGHAYWTLDSRPTGESHGRTINCTAVSHGNDALRVQAQNGAVVSHECVNMLVLSNGAAVQSLGLSGGTATLTGSNNFGGATNPFPVALQGSPYPITASTAYDPGAGDFALYVGKNGALLDSPNNDVVGQGVGPSANSDVPTTDILGNARSGATANPGAFEVPQATATITKTIGPSGRDYTTFTLAEADVTNIGGSADLVNENERIVFEADAGTYTGGTQINSTLVTDPTRNVTYTVAAGSEHGGDPASGVIIETSGSASTAGIWVYDSHTIFDGLNLKTTVGQDSKGWRFQDVASVSTVIRNCIFVGSSSGSLGSDAIYALYHGYSAVPTVVENCRLSGPCFLRTTSTDGNWRFINNTLLADSTQPTVEFRGIVSSAASGTTMTVDVTNNWGNCTRSYYAAGAGTTNLTGSNNYGEGAGVYDFPAAIRGTPYPITATTDTSPGAGDWAIYQASNGQLYYTPDNDVLGKGAGPAFDPNVPAADILGGARTGTRCNPGAFEETLPVLPELPPPGVISVGNSSVTTNDATGKMADGKQGALVRVTVRDTSNQGLPYSQVWISDSAQVPFISAAYKPDGPDYDGTFRSPNPVVTDAAGVAAFYVYGLKAHTQTFQVEAGAPTPEWNASASPVAKPTTGTVGDQSATWASTYSGDQTIDSAWLAAYGGSVVTNVKFTGGQVTVTDSSARFVSCTFTAGAASNYAVVYERSADPAGATNSTFVNCTIQGGRLAAVRMHRASMYQTLVEEAQGHGVYITANPNAASNARLALCIVRNVGLNAPAGKAGMYLEDAYRVELTGCSLECPHPSSAGGSATYNQDAALHVAAVDDPVLEVYCYTGWIDGTVRLKDGGLGTGPTGMMLGDLFWTRNYDPSGTALDSDCTSLWTKANYWVDTGQHMEAADGGAQINTFTGVKEANVWPRVLLGTVDITWDSAYANLPVTLNSLVPPSKPPTTQPQLALADMSKVWINAIPDLSVTWRLEPEGQAIYIPQIVDANRYYAGQIGWNDGGLSGEPASYNPPLIVVPLVRRDGSPLDLITGPGSPQNRTSS